MVVQTRWNVNTVLDISVIEQLTSDAGVPGSITGSAICFHLYFFVIYVFIPPIPTTWPSLIRHLYLIISPDRVNFWHVCL